MRPLIKIPQIVVNLDKAEKEVITRVNPNEIEYYYPGFHEGTVICMKSQNSFFTPLAVEQIDAMIEAYHNHTVKEPNKFGFLEPTAKTKMHVAD